MSRKKRIFFLLLAAGLLSACGTAVSPGNAASPNPAPTLIGQLVPYQPTFVTASPTPTTAMITTQTPPPMPTPTPRTHTVKKGEDLGGIAFQYHISVADLIAANPKVNPHAMSVGAVLVIPASKTAQQSPEAQASSQTPPAPTPIPLETGPINCARGEDGGIWCFQPVLNSQQFTLEGISAMIKISNGDDKPAIARTAFLPLDRLPPGMSMPLAAYFTPQQAAALTMPFQTTGTILTALTSADDGRYVETQMDNQKVMVGVDGLSAQISLDVRTQNGNEKARRVWVAAAAYDVKGNVVGVRRWENASDQILSNGQALPVSMNIYSISRKIARVELLAEARP